MANGVVSTLALDLPPEGRYVGSLQRHAFTSRTNPFLPFSINRSRRARRQRLFVLARIGSERHGRHGVQQRPATKDITSELKGKVSYRLYDYNNRTPELLSITG